MLDGYLLLSVLGGCGFLLAGFSAVCLPAL